MSQFKVFESFTASNLQKLSYYMEEHEFSIGNVIYQEGDKTDGVYLIQSGEYEILIKGVSKLFKFNQIFI